MRRNTIVCACAVGFLLLALGIPTQAATSEPIRVGFMATLSGLFAPAGRDMQEGFRLYFEQTGFQAAGRKIELIEEDDEGNNAVAVAKYRKLVSRDRVHVLGGILLTNIGALLAPMIERDQVPSLYLTTPDDLTKRIQSKWSMRTNFAASQLMHPLGEYAYKTLGYRKVATLGLDIGFGYEQIGGFHRVFEGLGGKVVQKLWTPLNTQDFAPYITQLRRDVDAVVVVYTSGQAIRFVKQYAEYGMKAHLPLVTSGVLTDEHALRHMGDEAIGIVSALNWSPVLQNPENAAFVKMAAAKLGKTPGYFHAVMYSAARWIVEAIKLLNGNVENRQELLAAIRTVAERPGDPRGPITFDEYNNPSQNVYILKVEKVGGKLQNTVIHTYPMVSQFWTYRPDTFLKDPPYSRDFPPVKP